jgi:hypothetical protein
MALNYADGAIYYKNTASQVVSLGGIAGPAHVWTTATLYALSSLTNDVGYLTSAVLASYGVSTITAGTDTAISTASGNVTVWNTSNLQSITNRGSVTTNTITAPTFIGNLTGTSTYASYAYSFNTGTLVANADVANKIGLNSSTDITVRSSLIPDTNISYDLGSATNRFRTLYISSGTIDIGGVLISVLPNSKLSVGGFELVSTATIVSTATSSAIAYSLANTSTTQVGYATTTSYALSFNTSTLVTNAVNATTSTYAAIAYSIANTSTLQVGYAVDATTSTYAAIAYSIANTSTLLVGYAVTATSIVGGALNPTTAYLQNLFYF